MKVEGIIIHKTAYKERDLICNMLLRSGKTVSVYFYGGQGGGKSMKGSILELGNMMKVQLNERRKKIESELSVAKEYNLLWSGKNVREDFQAFYLMTFYLEVLGKIALEEDLDDPFDDGHTGLFNVLSNSIFYLDDSVKNKKFNTHTHLLLFFSKLFINLGVNIDVENCLHCGIDLQKEMSMFDPTNGGFSCRECNSKKDEFLTQDRLLMEEYQSSTRLLESLRLAYKLVYKDYTHLGEIDQGLTVALFNYFNQQFGFSKDQFKTWGMISAF